MILYMYETCFGGICNTVTLVLDMLIRNLFCLSQITMSERNIYYILLLCAIVSISLYCEIYHSNMQSGPQHT